jgi:hypothetical protein
MHRRIEQDIQRLSKDISSFKEAESFAQSVENALKQKGNVQVAVDCIVDFCQGFLDRGEAGLEKFRGVQRRVWYKNTLAIYLGLVGNVIHSQFIKSDHEETMQSLIHQILLLVDDLLRGLARKDNLTALKVTIEFCVEYMMIVHCYMVKLLRPYHWQRAVDRIKDSLESWKTRVGKWEELALTITLLQALFDLSKEEILKDDRYPRLVTRYIQDSIDIKGAKDTLHLLPASLMVTETHKWQDEGAWVPYQPQSSKLLEAGYFMQILPFLLRPTHQTAPEMEDFVAGITQMVKAWRRHHDDNHVDFDSEEDEPDNKQRDFIREGWEKNVELCKGSEKLNWMKSIEENGELDPIRWKR